MYFVNSNYLSIYLSIYIYIYISSNVAADFCYLAPRTLYFYRYIICYIFAFRPSAVFPYIGQIFHLGINLSLVYTKLPILKIVKFRALQIKAADPI
jgi:hypothetical protein